jgi:hypothetical protein
VTFTVRILCCQVMEIGRWVHVFALSAGLDELVNASTAVLDAYSKRGAQ